VTLPSLRGGKRKIVVGITGASGAPYAKRLLQVLAERITTHADVEVAVCISSTAPQVWALECGGDLRDEIAKLGAMQLWSMRDYNAPFASGSAGWDAMAIVPCSMGTCARVAQGISDTLLTRAADVMLKERRSLVVVPRETPLSVIHLENLLVLARAGAMILPAMPSFYGKATTYAGLVDTVVTRTLDHLGVPSDLTKRWGEGEMVAT
jgi:flavin prenyltransferase